MKIILHGQLAKQFGREHHIQTDRVADAVEGLSRQMPDWPRDMLIDVVDHDTTSKILGLTDAKEIHLVPSMRGGSGKWGKIIVGSALIAAMFIPGVREITLIAASKAFTGVTVGSVLFAVGTSLILAGTMQFFMKAPSVSKSSDPPPSKYLGINRNTSGIGTYRGMAAGRIRVAGHWLSLQSDSSSLVFGKFPTTTS